MAAVPRTEQVLTTLTPEDRDRLDAYAEREKVSRADAIRTFILNGLNSPAEQRAAQGRS